MSGVRGHLGSYEIALCDYVAERRQTNAKRNGYRGCDDHVEDPEGLHRGGVYGEMIVAKYLGLWWHALAPEGDFLALPADVGERVEVRTTKWATGRLRVKPTDPDDHIFYLVVGEVPDYLIVGWLMGREAKFGPWFVPSWGTFAAPQSGLHACAGRAEVATIERPPPDEEEWRAALREWRETEALLGAAR